MVSWPESYGNDNFNKLSGTLFNLASRLYVSLLVPINHKLYGLINRTVEQSDKCTDKGLWLEWDSNPGNSARHTPEATPQTTEPRACSN